MDVLFDGLACVVGSVAREFAGDVVEVVEVALGEANPDVGGKLAVSHGVVCILFDDLGYK